jgi:hypothetical protein
MSARENAQRAIEQLTRKAKPARIEKNLSQGVRELTRYTVACSMCPPEANIHFAKRHNAKGCERHRAALKSSRWAKKNPERRLEYSRLDYARNREKRLKQLHTYREANRERINARQRAYNERMRAESAAGPADVHYTKLALI